MSLNSVKKQVLSQISAEEATFGEIMFNNCDCQILSQSAVSIDFLVNTADDNESAEYSLLIEGAQDGDISLYPAVNNKTVPWDRCSYACLLQYEQELSILDPKDYTEHKKYTRRGMIKRVLDERRQKAEEKQEIIQPTEQNIPLHRNFLRPAK